MGMCGNIVCKLESSSEKRPCWTCPGTCSFPPPSPRKKLSTTYPKRLPIKTSHTDVLAPGQILWTTPIHESTTEDLHR